MAWINRYQAPQMDLSQYSQSMGGFDQQMQGLNATQGMFAADAQGLGPNAGMAQANAGAQQQANFARAMGASATGLGRGNAMKSALGQSAGASQNAGMLGQQLQASQQMQGAAQQLQSMMQQRAMYLQAQGMSAQAAMQQANLEMQTGQLNAKVSGIDQSTDLKALAAAGQVVGAAAAFA